MRHIGVRLAVPVLMLVLGGAATGIAQEGGVHVDPESPAGKEYAFPLDAARRNAEGGDNAAGNGGQAGAPLFGAGVSTRSAASSKASAAGERSPRDPNPQSADGDSESAQGPATGDADATRAARAVAASGGGLSPGLAALLISLGVLAVGGIIGLSVRFLRGTDPTS